MRKRNFFGILACFSVLAISHGATYNAQHNGPDIKDCTVIQANELLADASALYDKGSFTNAANLAEKAAQIREQCLGANDPATAEALNLSGRYYRYAGQYKKARKLLDRALSIRTILFGEESVQVADTLNNLGGVDYFQFDPGTAEAHLSNSLAIRIQLLGRDHPDTLVSMQNVALIQIFKGHMLSAKPIVDEVLATQQRNASNSTFSYAKTLLLSAYIFQYEGNFIQAEQLFLSALAITEKSLGINHPQAISIRQDLGWNRHLTGAYGPAEVMLTKSLKELESAVGPEHQLIAKTLTSLALLYARTGRFEEALPLQQRVLAIREKQFDEDHLDTATPLNNLGELYIATHRYPEAESVLRRALLIKTARIPGSSSYALTLFNLAILHMRTHDTERAIGEIKEAIQIREQTLGVDHPLTTEAVAELATLNWSIHKYAEATELFERVQKFRAANTNRILGFFSESRNEAYLRTLSDYTNRFISFALDYPSVRSTAIALQSGIQFKARALSTMSDNLAMLHIGSNTTARHLVERRQAIASQLSALTFQLNDFIDPLEYKETYQRLRAELESLDSQLAGQSVRTGDREGAIGVGDVLGRIPKNAVVIEFIKYTPYAPQSPQSNLESHYAAFVLRPDRTVGLVDLGSAQAIDSATSAFRRALTSSESQSLQNTAQTLSELIVRPLMPHIIDSTNVFISADGALNLVPISALLNDQGDYLANHYAISYLSSTRDLLRLNQHSAPASDATIVADPDFGPMNRASDARSGTQQTAMRSPDLDRSGIVFRSLPNTALEAQELQKLLKLDNSDVYLHADANESALKKLHGPRILHIASHGFFLSDQVTSMPNSDGSRSYPNLDLLENPLLRSGLALSGANTRHSANGEDGILTALEVAQMDLHGTQLVVLSACDSGVGDIKNGEGVYGLRRALVLAGAQTQVTSLWKVSDEATRHLMVSFYRRLAEDAGRAEALAEAQREMIKSREYSHPYYWASFIPSGDWSPLPKTH